MTGKVKHFFTVLAFIFLVLCTSSCQNNAEPPLPDDTGGNFNSSPADFPEAPKSAESQPEQPAARTLLDSLPPYSGDPYTEINNNIPFFTENDYTTDSFENYSPLDSLGRCDAAFANIGQDLMPTEDIGSIGHIRPSGWHTVKYDIIDGNYLYNRCHLIGYQLTAEGANEKNLITGTRCLNVAGMLPFENITAEYIKETGHHVLYRVTPLFRDENLVSDGVLMEAWSVEDSGDGICFCVFVYNVQPGIVIDYATGESSLETPTVSSASQGFDPGASPEAADTACYILNTNTKKFHLPSCASVEDMAEKNKETREGTRQDMINMGYTPCKRCQP